MLHLSSAVLRSHRQLSSTSSGTGSYTVSPILTARGSFAIAGVAIRWFRHDHFHISSFGGEKLRFLSITCVPSVGTALCGQEMFLCGLSAIKI